VALLRVRTAGNVGENSVSDVEDAWFTRGHSSFEVRGRARKLGDAIAPGGKGAFGLNGSAEGKAKQDVKPSDGKEEESGYKGKSPYMMGEYSSTNANNKIYYCVPMTKKQTFTHKICMNPRMPTPYCVPKTGMNSSRNELGQDISERNSKITWKMMKR